MKEYCTIEEQIELLKEKRLLFENEEQAKEILKKENYYNVINGYKDLFIEEHKVDEKFKKGVTFVFTIKS